jgi:hypothetical protein
MTTIKKPLLSSKAKKIIIGFLLMQSIFAINTYVHLNKIIESKVNEIHEGYNNYNNFYNATKNTDQEKIIYHFGTLMDKNAISDLLLVGMISVAKFNGKSEIEKKSNEDWAKKFPKEAEEERGKWTEETKQFIIENYLRTPKAGLLRDRNMFNQMSCLIIDLSCEKMKKQFIEKNEELLKNIEYKIDVRLYDINHPEEYLSWKEKWLANIKNSANRSYEEHLSPGAKVMQRKN